MKIGTVLFFVVMLVTAGGAVAMLFVLFNSAIGNKAGPSWIWRLGKFDPLRNIFFRPDGSLRRYSRVLISAILIPVLLMALFLAWVAVR